MDQELSLNNCEQHPSSMQHSRSDEKMLGKRPATSYSSNPTAPPPATRQRCEKTSVACSSNLEDRKDMGDGKMDVGGDGVSSDHVIQISSDDEKSKMMKDMISILHELLPHLPPEADELTILREAAKRIRILDATLHDVLKNNVERDRATAVVVGAANSAFPGVADGTFPAVNNIFPTANDTFLGAINSVSLGAANGAFPGAANGALLGVGSCTFPGATNGIFPGDANGTFLGAGGAIFPGAVDSAFPGIAANSSLSGAANIATFPGLAADNSSLPGAAFGQRRWIPPPIGRPPTPETYTSNFSAASQLFTGTTNFLAAGVPQGFVSPTFLVGGVRLMVPPGILPTPSAPVPWGQQKTWMSPHGVVSVCGLDAHISVYLDKKPDVLQQVFAAIEGQGLDVLSAEAAVPVEGIMCLVVIRGNPDHRLRFAIAVRDVILSLSTP